MTTALSEETELLLNSTPEGDQPAWFHQLQADGLKTFAALPTPGRTDEAWRFAKTKALDLSAYTRPQPVSEQDAAELVERSSGLGETAGRMIFANDTLLERSPLPAELQAKGVIFESIETAIAKHADLFRTYFMTQEVVLGSRKYAALHQAWVKAGTFLYVPKGVEIEMPIEAFHWLHGSGGSTFPHTLLIADEGSKVTFVENFESSDSDSAGFACGVNDLFVGRGAQLKYVCVQNWSRKTLAIQVNSTVVGADASAVGLNVNLGGFFARTESVSRLTGPGGRSDMLALNVAEGTQEFDQRTLQDHQQPNTSSDLLYKNALDDAARTIFAGLIRVQPKAHRTDAYQKVRNLLLSDDAEANSMPGLEILADEVRCTHGATSGQIHDEELFYLLARGISRKAAQRLIVTGFLNEVIERFGHETVGERLRAILEGKQR